MKTDELLRKIEALEVAIKSLEGEVQQLKHPAKYKMGDSVYFRNPDWEKCKVEVVCYDVGWTYQLNIPDPYLGIKRKVREEELMSLEGARGLCGLL